MFSVKLCIIGILLLFGNTNSRKLGTKHLPDTNVCGRQTTELTLVGEVTDLKDLPWLALLEYKTLAQGRKFFCGGALISSRYGLTVAHCIKENLVSVRLGEHDVTTERDCEDTELEYCSDSPIIVNVEEKIPYESYTKSDINQHGDIALLRQKEEVAFTEFIKPICLPLSEELKGRAYAETKMMVAGWGKTESTTHSNGSSYSTCSAYYERYRVSLIGSQLCAGGEKGENPCNGESGGPLMYAHITIDSKNWRAVGVASFGPNKCGSENIPTVYARVSSFMDWILSNLKP